MVIAVKLEGLNVVCPRGKWYVYYRSTGHALIKGFKGSKEELEKHMESLEFLSIYTRHKTSLGKTVWPEGTLGAVVGWYLSDSAAFSKLSEATKKDYRKAFDHLKSEFDFPLKDLEQGDIYQIQNDIAKARTARFADKVVSALSAMFTIAVKNRKMTKNPALGVSKMHSSAKSANREWTPAEFEAVLSAAPKHLKTVLLIARHAGFRGQTIHSLTWRNYQDHPQFTKCFRVQVRKNDELAFVPAVPEIQTHFDTLDKTSTRIATKADGKPWKDEVQMQTEISHFLRDLERKGLIGGMTTLHGLRVTYAADLKRSGAETGDVASALGDKSERMGAHYTRHVENETRVIRAFSGKMKPKKERD
jgi:hypothetical protein